jgi:ABC-type multidrug transport system fused ATPase/permease subunit
MPSSLPIFIPDRPDNRQRGRWFRTLDRWRSDYLAGMLTLGTLIAFIYYAGQFFDPINQIAAILVQLQGAQSAGERVLSLLATEPKIKGQCGRSETAGGVCRNGPAIPTRHRTASRPEIDTGGIQERGFCLRDRTSRSLKAFNLDVNPGGNDCPCRGQWRGQEHHRQFAGALL